MGGLEAGAGFPWPSFCAAGGLLVAIAVVAIVLLARVFGASLRSMSLRNESERLKSEVALARAEARFRTVFEGAPLGIVVVDVDGTLRETNAAFDLMLGYERRELVGKTMHELSDDSDRERLVEAFGALVRGEVSSYEQRTALQTQKRFDALGRRQRDVRSRGRRTVRHRGAR